MQTTNNGPGRGPILWSMGPTPGPNSGALIPSDTPSCFVLLTPATAPSERNLRPPSPEAHGTYNGQAIEPAVQYVQKIKNRCDPETYRQFLDILSRYHHRPETIDEVRVQNSAYSYFPNVIYRKRFHGKLPGYSRMLRTFEQIFGSLCQSKADNSLMNHHYKLPRRTELGHQ